MKEKILFLAILCAVGFCKWEVQAMNSNHVTIIYMYKEDNVPTGYEEIVLQGKLDCNAGSNAIVAGANESSVYIHFNQSFGNVNISIYNVMGGLVYSTVVNTDVQQTIIIPFFNVLSGTYTVELSNANGYVEGDFDKD